MDARNISELSLFSLWLLNPLGSLLLTGLTSKLNELIHAFRAFCQSLLFGFILSLLLRSYHKTASFSTPYCSFYLTATQIAFAEYILTCLIPDPAALLIWNSSVQYTHQTTCAWSGAYFQPITRSDIFHRLWVRAICLSRYRNKLLLPPVSDYFFPKSGQPSCTLSSS